MEMSRRICMVLLAAALSLGILAGCKKFGEVIQEAGLDKEFVLRTVPSSYQDEHTMFFHFNNPQAPLLGEKTIKLFWGRNPEELNVTTVHFSNINFISDEGKEVPTVTFVFVTSWLRQETQSDVQRTWIANILNEQPVIPNQAVYGVTIRINRRQYIDLMLAALGQREDK